MCFAKITENDMYAYPNPETEKIMHTLNDFELKRRKYMPTFPKANGKPTIYIQGYPCEDDQPMAVTGFHALKSVHHLHKGEHSH